MKHLIIATLLLTLVFTACAPARQKLSPQANVALKDANVFYQQKNVEKALESYHRVLKDNPDYVIALRRVADINMYYGEQDQSKAIEYNKKAYEFYTKAIAITETFEPLKETDHADLRDMRRRQKGSWTRIYNASELLLNQGNTQEALKGFKIAAELDDERFEPLIKMKDIYEKELKDPVQAEAILLKLYEKKPKEALLLQELGAFYFNKPDYPKSLEFFKKALLEMPLNTDIMMNISFCYYEMKDYANALKSTQAVLEIEPKNMDAIKNARSIALMIEDTPNAIQYTIQILEIDENDTDYMNLCRLLMASEKYAELIVWGEKWFKYDPTSTIAAQYVSLAANRTNNKALETKYNNILRTLQ